MFGKTTSITYKVVREHDVQLERVLVLGDLQPHAVGKQHGKVGLHLPTVVRVHDCNTCNRRQSTCSKMLLQQTTE